MNCKQVNNLSFAYCDNEVHNHTRAELERHLQECPDCQKMMDFTARETEALRYDEDIPDLRLNFSQDIILEITRKYSAKKSLRSGWVNRKRLRNIMTGNIVAGSLAAVLLLSWFLVPGVRENLMSTFDSSADKASQTKLAQNDSAAQPETLKALPKAGTNAPITMTLPTGAKWAPDYNTSTPRKPAGRSGASLNEAASSQNYGEVKVSVPMFQPLYLPEGYHLTEVVPDTDGNCTLAYKNNQGSLISLKIVQIGNEVIEQLDASGAPKVAENDSVSNGSGVQQQAALKMSPVPPVVNSTEESKVESTPAVDEEQAKTPSAANEAANSSNQATMIWTMQNDGKFYCLELAGALSPEELGKIAASVQAAE